MVSQLLMLHGLHPSTFPRAIGQALDKVRPLLHSHGGDVELLGHRQRPGAVAAGRKLPRLSFVNPHAQKRDRRGALRIRPRYQRPGRRGPRRIREPRQASCRSKQFRRDKLHNLMNREGNPRRPPSRSLRINLEMNRTRGLSRRKCRTDVGNGTGLSSLSRSLATLRNLSPRCEKPVACEMCSQPLARRASAPDRDRSAAAPVRLRRVPRFALFRPRRPTRKYRRVPRRSLLLPDFRLERRAVGRASDPDQHGVLLSQHAAGHGSSPFIPARPARRSRCWNWNRGMKSWRRTRCSRRWSPTWRHPGQPDRLGHQGHRCLLPQSGGRKAEALHFLAPIDECYKLVGVIRAHWRGLSGGKRSGTKSTDSSSICAADRQPRREPLEQGPKQCPT